MKPIWIIIFLGAVVALAFIPFFSGRILFEDDVTYYYLPSFKFYSDVLKSGESFYINPYVFSGFPQYLSQVGGFYEPINYIIFKFLPLPFSYHFRIFLNYWLAAIFMFLFGRTLGLGYVGSLTAAFGYLTAQGLVPGMNILRSNSFFLAPGLFYVILRLNQIWRDPHSRGRSDLLKVGFYVLLGSSVFAVSMLGGYTQLNIYALIGAGFFTLYLLIRRFSWKFLVAAGVMILLGILAIAPHILRIQELIPLTHRAGGLSFEEAKATRAALNILRNLTLNLIWPSFSFDTMQSLYVGTLGFVFAAAAFILPKSPIRWFFIGLLLFSVLSSFPYPLFWIMHFVPPFHFFRFPLHWLFIGSFALSILAGIGYQLLLESQRVMAWYSIRKILERPSTPVFIVAILALNFLIPAWITSHKLFLAQKNSLKLRG